MNKLPKPIEVNRSELRQDQSSVLKKAVGKRVVVVSGTTDDAEKYMVDKRYFEELLKQWQSAVETLEIAADKAILMESQLHRGGARIFDGTGPVFPSER